MDRSGDRWGDRSLPPFSVDILGPLEVREGDRVIALGGRLKRVLLAILALNANRAVPLDTLTRSTVYEYAQRRADPLPSVQIGRHRRFHRFELERRIARQRA